MQALCVTESWFWQSCLSHGLSALVFGHVLLFSRAGISIWANSPGAALIAEPSHELTCLQLLHRTFGLPVFALTGLVFSFMLAFTAVHHHIS